MKHPIQLLEKTPVYYYITDDKILGWLALCIAAMDPQVPFNRDNNVMLLDAYDVRGKAIKQIHNEIDAIVNPK